MAFIFKKGVEGSSLPAGRQGFQRSSEKINIIFQSVGPSPPGILESCLL